MLVVILTVVWILAPAAAHVLLADSLRQSCILGYQLISQLATVIVLARHGARAPANRKTWRTLLASMFCFLCAEVSFNTSFLVGNLDSYKHKFLGAFCYTLTFVFLAVALARHFGRRREELAFYFVASAVVVGHFCVQHVFLLVPLRVVYFAHLPWIMLPNGYAYSLATSVVTALCVLYSLRSQDLYEQGFLQTLLALLAFDFAARFQVVQHQFKSTDVSQALWAMACGAILCIVLASASRRRGILGEVCPAPPMRSVRVLLGAFIFLMTMALLAALCLAGLAAVHSAPQVTSVLVLLFCCWCASNIMAVRIAAKLRVIADLMPVPHVQVDAANGLGDLQFNPVEERSRLFEIDEMIAHHNRLVLGANELLVGLLKKDRDAVMGRLAVQVAHDIRSPLSALNMAVQDLRAASEDTRSLMRSAMFRIEDIANQLLAHRHKAQADDRVGYLLSAIVENLVSEKRCEYRARLGLSLEASFGPESYGVFATVNLREFKRALSNLINNAADALKGRDDGLISVQVYASDQAASVLVQDNGCGMPAEVLARLGSQGATHGKEAGNGVGVWHAMRCARQWGGELTFESEPGQGTAARLTLPRSCPPRWFVEGVKLTEKQTLVVVDDDASIHKIWSERMERLRHPLPAVHLSTPDALRAWCRENECSAFYMLDHEFFGHRETGLDLAAELSLGDNACLVTSRFEEDPVLQGCAKLGLGLIPKPTAAYVPLTLECSDVDMSRQLSHVLIDNDAMIRRAWEMNARWRGTLCANVTETEHPQFFSVDL